jgi:hypothetical protein
MWGVLFRYIYVSTVLLVNHTGSKELCLDHEAWGFSSAFFGCKEKQIARFLLRVQKSNKNWYESILNKSPHVQGVKRNCYRTYTSRDSTFY